MQLSNSIEVIKKYADVKYLESIKKQYFSTSNFPRKTTKKLEEGTLFTSSFLELLLLNKNLLFPLNFIIDDYLMFKIVAEITQNEYHNLWVAYHDFGYASEFRTQINGRWYNKFQLLGACTTINVFNVEGTFRYMYEFDNHDYLDTLLALEYPKCLTIYEIDK
jgi:hypothetical protein